MGAMLVALAQKTGQCPPWLALLFASALHGAVYGSVLSREPASPSPPRETAREPVAFDPILVEWESHVVGHPVDPALKLPPAAPLATRPSPPAPSRGVTRTVPASFPSASSTEATRPTSPPTSDGDDELVGASGPRRSARASGARGTSPSGAGGLARKTLGAGPSTRGSTRPQLLIASRQCADLFPYDATRDRAAVTVQLQINSHGRITRVALPTADKASEFAEAARRCAHRLRFLPARNPQGTPVQGNATLRLHFARQTFHRDA